MTPEDIERLNGARLKLDEQMAAVMARKGEAEKRVWKLEMAMAKTIKDLEDSVEAYNATLAELLLTPAIARAVGDTVLHLRVDSSNIDRPLSMDIKTQVQPLLRRVGEQLESESLRLGTEKLHVQDALGKAMEAVTEKHEDCLSMEQKLELKEQQYLQEKEV